MWCETASTVTTALAFDGPVGIRSDNAKLEIGLRTAPPLATRSDYAAGCRTGAGKLRMTSRFYRAACVTLTRDSAPAS